VASAGGWAPPTCWPRNVSEDASQDVAAIHASRITDREALAYL